MPWMQRIDSYGIALHGGMNPGFPASHGCVRLPLKFAEKLYTLTRVGSKVVIEG
jgi:lipoprotein-anchoring transpeptidase ErfK/SrfK